MKTNENYSANPVPARIRSFLFILTLCIAGNTPFCNAEETKQAQKFALGVEYLVPGLAEIYSKSGVQWAKAAGTGFAWDDVEPDPPVNGKHTYKWDNTDKLIIEYQRAGFKNFHIYTKARCSWASSKPLNKITGESYPPKPEYMDDYEAYIRNLVERYDKDGKDDAPGLFYPVLYYEIEAEWGTFWHGTAEEYIELLKHAHKAVKAACPDAKVILIGFFMAGVFEGEPIDDVEKALQRYLTPQQQKSVREGIADAKKLLSHSELFDVVEFHSLSDWTEIMGMTRFLRGLMKERGYEKPIWVGDVNYTASPLLFWENPVPPYTKEQKPALIEIVRILANPKHPKYTKVEAWFRAEQSSGLVKKTVLAMAENCAGINIGNLNDWDVFAFVPTIAGTAAFQGLVDKKSVGKFPQGNPARTKTDLYQPRPAFYALSLISRKLNDFTSVERLPLQKGVFAYRFNVNSRNIYVLWYDDGRRYLPGDKTAPIKVELPLQQKQYSVYMTPTKRGVEFPQPKIATPVNEKLTIYVSDVPVFIEEN